MEDGILRVLLGLVGPGLDLAVPGRAVILEGLEEVGGAAGPLLGGAPPVARAEEQGAGAGEGDVAEAQFLGVLVVLHGLVEGLHAAGVPAHDVGERVGVAAQSVRQHLGLGGPLLAALAAGEGAGDQAGDGDHVPLQALGPVCGEDLDGVLPAGQGVVQSLLVLGGGAQEAEEREQARLALRGGEGGGDVEEVRQGLAAAGRQGVRRRRELDLEAGDGEDAVQDVHQWVRQGAAQVAQFRREPGEPHARVRRERQPVVVAGSLQRRLEEGVERVRERDHLGRVHALDGRGEPPVRVVAVAPARVGHQQARASPQEG
ncbi:hypothetical protein RKD18_005417 [Streptomyces phaeoluteigriseus]